MPNQQFKFSNPSVLMGNSFRGNPSERKPLLVSLFAGTGGSSVGYRLAGYKELLAVELDKHAVECFSLNFPDVPIEPWNITKISGKDILNRIGLKAGELDFLDASPPCQALSRANTKAKIDDPKNELFLKTIRLIAEVQPKCFLIENVLGLLMGKNKVFFNKVKKLLKKLNYTWKYTVAKAELYGVPQARRRVIIIGIRNDVILKFDNPRFIPLPDLSKVNEMNLDFVFPEVAAFSPGQFVDKIHLANRPVCTITKTASLWFYTKEGIRYRPEIEKILKLMSFPDDFKLNGSFLNKWGRLGNAVPPKLTQAFAENIKKEFLTDAVLGSSDTVKNIKLCSDISNLYSSLGLYEFKFTDIKRMME